MDIRAGANHNREMPQRPTCPFFARSDRIRRPRTRGRACRLSVGARLRRAHPRSARNDSAAARRPRSARPGGDRHRKNGRVRAASCIASRTPARKTAGAPRPRARADARAGHAGGRGDPQVRARRPHDRAAALRRRVDAAADPRARTRRAHRRRDAGPRARSHPARHAEAGPARPPDAGRGGRNARHGLRRRPRRDPRATPPIARRRCFRRRCRRGSVDCGTHLRNPARVAIAREKPAAGKLPRVRQVAYIVARAHKPAALERVLETENRLGARVLPHAARGRHAGRNAERARHRAEALHGGMEQRQRDRVMGRFREGKADLLVATDVAARGLDIERLSHVVNYDVPASAESTCTASAARDAPDAAAPRSRWRSHASTVCCAHGSGHEAED